MQYFTLALALASVGSAAVIGRQEDCQNNYNLCLAAGNPEVKCSCDLSACAGEDNARNREFCATATASLGPIATGTAFSGICNAAAIARGDCSASTAIVPAVTSYAASGIESVPTTAPVFTAYSSGIESVGVPLSILPSTPISGVESVGVPLSILPSTPISGVESVGTPVTQIPDGQIQAPTTAQVASVPVASVPVASAPGSPITQIGDGQIQAPTYVASTAVVATPTATGGQTEFTGAASVAKPAMGLLALGALALL